MSIKLGEDFGEVEAWKGGTMLPLGYSTVRIDEAAEGRNAGDDHDVLELTFVGQGGSIRDWLHYTPGSAGKMAQLLDAVGIDRKGKKELSATELEGKVLRIFVTEEPDFKGETDEYGKIKMRRRVSAYEHTNADPQPDTRGLGNGRNIPDDDIPF